jgi:hypothetical protein
MMRTADLLTKLVIASVLIILPLGSVGAQKAVSARLSDQAGVLKQDIDLLTKSLSNLKDRVSPSLLSTMKNELSIKQAALDVIVERIRQSEILEHDVMDLTLLRERMQERSSAGFLTNLDSEIDTKQKELVELADTDPEFESRRVSPPRLTDYLPNAASLRTATYALAKPPNAPPTSADPYPFPANSRPVEATSDRSISENPVQTSIPPQNNATQQSPTEQNQPKICGGNVQSPCLDQPKEGSTTISGKAASGAMIEIRVNQSDVQKTTALQNGTFKITVNALKQGDTVKADQTAPAAVSMGTTTVPQSTEGTTSSLYTLGLAGINATGTSTSGPKQQYFAEFDLIAPLHWLGKGCWSPAKDSAGNSLAPVKGKTVRDDEIYPLEGRCWVWLNPRIASAPAAGSTALTSLTSASSLTQGIGTQTIGQITQTFEFQGGLEYYLIKPWSGALFGSNNSWAKTTVSLILGGGTVTPFNSISTANEFGLNNNLGKQFNESVKSNVNPTLPTLFPDLAGALCNFGFTGSPNVTCPMPTGAKTVAFVFPNRSRFYRDYYGGIRLRTFYFKGNCKKQNTGESAPASPDETCKPIDNFPGTFDARFGEDETVTGGKLRGVVLTLTGSYPYLAQAARSESSVQPI